MEIFPTENVSSRIHNENLKRILVLGSVLAQQAKELQTATISYARRER